MAAHKRFVSEAIGRVAEKLGNTKAVCRKCYVHPAVVETFFDGETIARWLRRAPSSSPLSRGDELSREEQAVMQLLRRRKAAEPRLRRKAA